MCSDERRNFKPAVSYDYILREEIGGSLGKYIRTVDAIYHLGYPDHVKGDTGIGIDRVQALAKPRGFSRPLQGTGIASIQQLAPTGEGESL